MLTKEEEKLLNSLSGDLILDRNKVQEFLAAEKNQGKQSLQTAMDMLHSLTCPLCAKPGTICRYMGEKEFEESERWEMSGHVKWVKKIEDACQEHEITIVELITAIEETREIIKPVNEFIMSNVLRADVFRTIYNANEEALTKMPMPTIGDSGERVPQ